VLSYLVRRLVAAIGLLFIVSVITFSIFYLVPRAAGRGN
jgi:peptide/nickel transport system permease protein